MCFRACAVLYSFLLKLVPKPRSLMSRTTTKLGWIRLESLSHWTVQMKWKHSTLK
jgi:hypothetical protein